MLSLPFPPSGTSLPVFSSRVEASVFCHPERSAAQSRDLSILLRQISPLAPLGRDDRKRLRSVEMTEEDYVRSR